MKVNDDRLMANVKTGIQEVARVRDVVGALSPGQPDHETARRRAGAFSGRDLSHRRSRRGPRCARSNIQLQPLAQAEKGYWGEVDYNSTDEDAAPVHAGPRSRCAA